MNDMKRIALILATGALALAFVGVGLRFAQRSATPAAPPPSIKAKAITVAPAQPANPVEPVSGQDPSGVPETHTISAATLPPAAPVKAAEPSVAKTPTPAPAIPTPGPPKDELARLALCFVGADSVAEEYWMEAINDPSLSADERQNLIEDLNEDGLTDPKHPSPFDLPLILSRIELIEELAPGTMDKVNSDAFLEAYKDLLNLAELAVGQGEPVQ
jgi:hypothetical protein